MKAYIKAAVWLLALILCLFGMDHALRRGDGKLKYQAFFEEKMDYDVFFLGTSHMMDAVYPIELWRDYGITSYNLGNTAEPMDNTYWTLRLASAYHMPKVAVIDVAYLDRIQTTQMHTYQFAHGFLDEIPLSLDKIRAVWSIFPEGKRAEFVFPLALYHTRWEELFDGPVQANTNAVPCMFGAELRVGRSEPAAYVRTQEMAEGILQGEQALRDMIALCRSKGIEPVLTAVPYPASREQQMVFNRARLLADELDVPMVNLFDVEGLVDFETDCYDPESHLNPDGATKVTAYLGAWLTKQYVLEDKRGDAGYAHWDAAAAEYEQLRKAQWSEMSLID